NSEAFKSADTLLLAMAARIGDELDLDTKPHVSWDSDLGASSNFESFIRRRVLGSTHSHVVLGLDEVDRIFDFDYAGEIFGLFRSWHNRRALDPLGPWSRLTIAIAYATEAHLFITDLNQSPFNVGTRLTLEDFTLEQVVDLNRRYDEPLRERDHICRFHKFFGGHPYLSQRGLYEMASGSIDLETIEAHPVAESGIFGDHLKRLLVSLRQNQSLFQEVQAWSESGASLSEPAFYKLRSAGVLIGESHEPRFRCELYERYLRKHPS